MLNGIPAPGNTFVLPRHKMVYVSVTKVACTSLRWMVADLAGEDLESFYDSTAAHQTRLMTIHRARTHWQHTPQLFQIPVADRAPISRDNGWLIFAVVRDPWSRLFSGWQSKFLVRHGYYRRLFSSESWYPRIPERAEHVLEDFRAFVLAEAWVTHPELASDVHFLPQVSSVRPHGINYTKIYDIADLATLFDDIHSHLQGLGLDQELYVPRANETPLPMIREVLADGLAELIQKQYQPDFDEWGDRWDLGSLKMAEGPWSQDAIRHAAYHIAANERIGDLSRVAKEYRRAAERANHHHGQLRARLTALQSSRRPKRRGLRSVAAAVARRARDLLDRDGRGE